MGATAAVAVSSRRGGNMCCDVNGVPSRFPLLHQRWDDLRPEEASPSQSARLYRYTASSSHFLAIAALLVALTTTAGRSSGRRRGDAARVACPAAASVALRLW